MGLLTTDDIRAKIIDALKSCDGNRTHAAEYLGISRQHMHRLMARYLMKKELAAMDRAQQVAACAK